VFLFLTVALTLPAGYAWSAVIHVPGDFPTIQDGLDAAATGDTVLVAAGTYTGPNNRNLTFGGQNMVLLSASGASMTTIDCQGLARGLTLTGPLDETAVVDGFTITNGHSDKGAGISATDSSSVTVKNCVIVANVSTKFGGGVFVSDASSPTFANCTIEGNDAQQGGGGVRVGDQSTARFLDCTIGDNTAKLGGGIIANDDLGSLFSNCIVRGNRALQDGGGAFVTANSFLIFDGCTISGNLAMNGGGLMIFMSSPTIARSTIAANRALLSGGGLYLSTAVVPPVMQTIVWSNCADQLGDQVYAASGSISFACSDVDDAGVEGGGTVSYDANTIHADPLFCQERLCTFAPTTAGEYTLDDDSPALAAFSPCGELIGSQPQGCTGRSFNVVSGGQWGKIQDAIDHAASGVEDTVVVGDSTWTGVRNTELDFGGKKFLLKSQGGAEQAIIDGGGTVRAIVFQNGEDNGAVVEGFTFKGGASSVPGASVLVKGGSSPVIRGCIIKENNGVGGVVRVESGSPVFEEVTIEENTASDTDGVVAFLGGNPKLQSCIVRNNASARAVSVATPSMISASQIVDNDGFGIYFTTTPSSLVEDSEISRNGGRGVVLDASDAEFNGVAFRENGDGGVIVTGLVPGRMAALSNGDGAAAPPAPTQFVNCEFSGHSADRGSGFFFDCTNEPEGTYTVTFINCRVTGNHATFEGGGVAVCGRATNGDIVPVFQNCTIAANSAQDGGGIYMGVTEVGIGRSARAEFSRSILWGNCSTAFQEGEAFVVTGNEIAIDCSHARLEEMAGLGLIDTALTTTGNPQFCDYPAPYAGSECQPNATIQGDFGLALSSPAAPENHPCGPQLVGAFPVNEECVPTAIGDEPVSKLRTELRPPVPNPFNPITTVEYVLEVGAHVSLRVYDVAGRLARVLVDQPMTEGVHRTVWDGRDQRGNPAASGVYFLRLEAGPTAQTQKMVLLK
jgi:hypothetical protein